MAHVGLMLAALLTICLGVAHSWLGERLLLQPMLKGPRAGILTNSRLVSGTLRFAWHITSLTWWGIAAILAALAFFPLAAQDRLVLALIAATFLLTSMTILLTSRGRHMAWPVFLAVAALSAVTAWPIAA